MGIVNAEITDIDDIAQLIAEFRVELRSFRNPFIKYYPDLEAAKKEFEHYMKSNFPVYIFRENNIIWGYLVCRIDAPVVWVESLFVRNEYRRKGVASVLFGEAEKLAHSYGQDTLYNYVHPNNDTMIRFLAKKGYDVLNLIEIRKKHQNENTTRKFRVANNEFNY